GSRSCSAATCRRRSIHSPWAIRARSGSSSAARRWQRAAGCSRARRPARSRHSGVRRVPGPAPASERVCPLVGSPMTERRVDAFFYGLFMDRVILGASGVAPVNPRRVYVDDVALWIGQRATLVPSRGARAYGMLFALTHAELDRLYTAPGLEAYRAE